jgi:uncharacterized protein
LTEGNMTELPESILDAVPGYPDDKPLELSDKPTLDAVFAADPPAASEMTFTNLFAWSGTHPVHITRIQNTVAFLRANKGAHELLPPAGAITNQVVETALGWAREHGAPGHFAKVPEARKDAILAALPILTADSIRDDADYVYLASDLSELAGRKYDGKRNLVKKFHKTVNAEFSPITPDLLASCIELQEFWCSERECAIHADLDAENLAIAMILEHWEKLGLIGGAMVAEGKVLAFSVAEKLSPGTAVIHFEKGDSNFPGSYQAINQNFVQASLTGFDWINREQDLGVPGLRKAKESYHPDHLTEKFTIR